MALNILFSVYVIIFIICNSSCLQTKPTREEFMKQLSDVPSADSTLLLAHVFFRHGARFATIETNYPNNPYKYASYFPKSIGSLQNAGEMTSYKLGVELRKRYDRFLGNIYHRDLIASFTSASERTEASLQCALAGLFPLSENERFLADLQWRPITYNIIPTREDEMLGVYRKCNNFFNFTSKVDEDTQKLYDYVSYHSGEKIHNNTGLFVIKETIAATVTMGWKLPAWVSRVYPEPLTSMNVALNYDIIHERLRIGVAGVLRRLIQDSKDKLNGSLDPPRRKMFLFSSHEHIFLILAAVEAYSGQLPQFSSYIAIELHHINDTFGFKMYFQNYKSNEPERVNMFNQGEFCPLNIFVEKTHWLLHPKPECP